jgi:chemotaxis protein methyltransferase CheR
LLTEEMAREADSDPVILFLARRAEDILGIKAAPDALYKLKEYLEERSGAYAADFAAYNELLSAPEGLAALTRILTVNETYFFREPAHFKLLTRRLLPGLSKLSRPARICSAAASTGCEAYSIAMVIDFYARGRDLLLPETGAAAKPGFDHRMDYQIDAFDVNPSVIEAARNGRYTKSSLREDGAEWHFIMDLYLRRDGEEYEIAQALRDKVRFFTHNIMDGINGSYDIIFFRNALIYFSPEKRRKILDSLAGALAGGGVLVAGVSETSSVEHPLLESRHTPEAFYFRKRKTPLPEMPPLPERKGGQAGGVPAALPETAARPETAAHQAGQEEPLPAAEKEKAALTRRHTIVPKSRTAPPKGRAAVPPDMGVVMALLENGEGRPNARKTAEFLGGAGGGAAQTPGESELIAAAIVFLGAEEFENAEKAVAFLEEGSNSAAATFLRGEYCYLTGDTIAAEEKYQEASFKDRAFWPAFYRVCSFAAPGNRTRYEYKVRKTLESMEAGKDLRYESFIGGFSPDYYRRILERKLHEN